MPLLKITSNQPMHSDKQDGFLRQISQTVADILGKSEKYVMVSWLHNPTMLFAGSSDPLVYVEFKSIGLPEDRTSDLSQTICELMAQELGIGKERMYIEFSNAQRHMWGWNGGTF